jgi:hypothetical protein
LRWVIGFLAISLFVIPQVLAVQWNADNYEVRTGQANFQMGRQYTFSILMLVSNGIEVAHDSGSFLFNVSSDSGIPTVIISDFWNDNKVTFNISASNGVTSTLVFNRTFGIKDLTVDSSPITEYSTVGEIVAPGWSRDQAVITAMVLHGATGRIIQLDFDSFTPPPPGGGGGGGGPGAAGLPPIDEILPIPLPDEVLQDVAQFPLLLVFGIIGAIVTLAFLSRSPTKRGRSRQVNSNTPSLNNGRRTSRGRPKLKSRRK